MLEIDDCFGNGSEGFLNERRVDEKRKPAFFCFYRLRLIAFRSNSSVSNANLEEELLSVDFRSNS